MSACSGILLAGGRSRRMGADKATLPLQGRTLAERGVAVLGELTDDVVLARGTLAPLEIPGTREVPDPIEHAGPLAGLVAGLRAARHPRVAVLATDLLAPRADVLARLIERLGAAQVAMPLVGGRPQPLHAAVARSSLSTLERALAEGERRLLRALDALDVRLVGPEGWGDLDPDGGFARDADVPGDLAGATDAMGGSDRG